MTNASLLGLALLAAASPSPGAPPAPPPQGGQQAAPDHHLRPLVPADAPAVRVEVRLRAQCVLRAAERLAGGAVRVGDLAEEPAHPPGMVTGPGGVRPGGTAGTFERIRVVPVVRRARLGASAGQR